MYGVRFVPLTSGNAYKIFRDQLDQQLGEAERTLSQGPETLSRNELGELRTTFHTIRGGAGFLGFPDLADAAKQLEDLFKGAAESVVSQLDEIKSLVERMEDLAKELPEPAATSLEQAKRGK
ncbi:MAG: hypothetical protein DCC75_10275 [Proteobacteria bacterium]|nr:MAG: hypothetical protein DCC75_10275 [Pseudomonadota bacterium]